MNLRFFVAAAVVVFVGGVWLATDKPDGPPPPLADPVVVDLVYEPNPEPVIEPFLEPVPSPVPVVVVAAPVEVAVADPVEPPACQQHAVVLPTFVPGARMIALLIDDMGEARMWSDRIVALPGPLTLSYFPHSPDLAEQVEAARRGSHEIMLHLPMEPEDQAENPGPDPLLTGLNADELRRRAISMLDSIDGYVGGNNHMGSRFTTDETAMALVLAEVQERGLLFVDSRTESDSVGERLARALGVPTLRRDVFLDNDADGVRIGMQLDALERHARDHGYAIGIAHPRPKTIEVLSRWLSNVARRGFVLDPISTIAARDQGTEMAAGE